MNKLFTGAGDDGSTGYLGEGRMPKEDIRFETLGTLDEASAHCGLVRSLLGNTAERETIKQIQADLYHIMAEAASDHKNAVKFRAIGQEQVTWLEKQAERLAETVKMPSGFILPGDTLLSAQVSITRTVVRRAERRLATMVHQGMLENTYLLKYLNRLSSLLFVLEVKTAKEPGSHITFA